MEARPSPPMSIKLLTYNVEAFHAKRGATPSPDGPEEKVCNAILEANADVAVLQETHNGWNELFASRLKKQYPHNFNTGDEEERLMPQWLQNESGADVLVAQYQNYLVDGEDEERDSDDSYYYDSEDDVVPDWALMREPVFLDGFVDDLGDDVFFDWGLSTNPTAEESKRARINLALLQCASVACLQWLLIWKRRGFELPYEMALKIAVIIYESGFVEVELWEDCRKRSKAIALLKEAGYTIEMK